MEFCDPFGVIASDGSDVDLEFVDCLCVVHVVGDCQGDGGEGRGDCCDESPGEDCGEFCHGLSIGGLGVGLQARLQSSCVRDRHMRLWTSVGPVGGRGCCVRAVGFAEGGAEVGVAGGVVRGWWLGVLVVMAALLFVPAGGFGGAGGVFAQRGGADGGGAGLGGSGGVGVGGGVMVGEVELSVVQAGVGGWARAGEWCGIELGVLDRGAVPRNVLLRWSITDPDGDTAQYQTVVATTPGRATRAWMYVYLPHGQDFSTTVVTAHVAEEGGGVFGGGDGASGVGGVGGGVTAGRLLGGVELRSLQVEPAGSEVIGVIGRRSASIDQYMRSRLTAATGQVVDQGHGAIRVMQIEAGNLPTRWQGLASLRTLVWVDTDGVFDPLRLTAEQASALSEWVRRGGHLVVVMPSVAQPWFGVSQNRLWSGGLLPTATATAHEGVSLEAIWSAIGRGSVRNLRPATLWTFREMGGSTSATFVPIFRLPERGFGSGRDSTMGGEPFVVRRLVGTGMVTAVGIASQTELRADVFWHRVLGRRGRLLDRDDLNALVTGQQQLLSPMMGRPVDVIDNQIGGMIAKSGAAAAGLLLAVVVFGAYWSLAGPVSYVLLRRRGTKQHAWIVFVLIVGLFTLIAWGGASSLRSRELTGTHVTFLDHVAGQPVQTTRSWINLFTPGYGDRLIRVGEWGGDGSGGIGIGSGGGGGGGAITVWASEEVPRSVPFPDARAYVMDAGDPSRVVLPSRSTVRQFRADWSGGPRWRTPLAVGDGGASDDGGGMAGESSAGGAVADGGVVLERVAVRPGRQWRLSGRLVHELPGGLRNVWVVVVPGQSDFVTMPDDPRVTRTWLNGEMFALPAAAMWGPGQVLDLGEVTGVASQAAHIDLDRRTAKFEGSPFGGAVRSRWGAEQLNELAFVDVFGVPTPAPAGMQRRLSMVRRSETQAQDFSRWFTQPCVMIIGQIENGPSPTPLYVDGQLVVLEGLTIVRWVYPLEGFAPGWRAAEDGGGAGVAGPGTGPVEGGESEIGDR